ncbi:MAG: SIMPL domain-containing protein [Rickettsiaceae bacterium]|nr:SIMPL domain-containing protein [Rickettsiaceae bacterium]
MYSHFSRIFKVIILLNTITISNIFADTTNIDKSDKNLRKPEETILNLAATEQKEIMQDLLVASMRFEYEGTDAKTVQNEVNKVMNRVVELTKKRQGISIMMGGYNVSSYYKRDRANKTKEPKQKIWRATQTINLSSKNSDDLLKLAGRIQNLGLVMNNLSYRVSPEKTEQARNDLIEQALNKLMAKAGKVAKTLNKTKIEVIEVNIDPTYYRPYKARNRHFSAMSESADSGYTPPFAVAGHNYVSTTVTAIIALSR